jgi:hypothetical protein
MEDQKHRREHTREESYHPHLSFAYFFDLLLLFVRKNEKVVRSPLFEVLEI